MVLNFMSVFCFWCQVSKYFFLLPRLSAQSERWALMDLAWQTGGGVQKSNQKWELTLGALQVERCDTQLWSKLFQFLDAQTFCIGLKMRIDLCGVTNREIWGGMIKGGKCVALQAGWCEERWQKVVVDSCGFTSREVWGEVTKGCSSLLWLYKHGRRRGDKRL